MWSITGFKIDEDTLRPRFIKSLSEVAHVISSSNFVQ
jgi:hypothetical protein